MSFLTKFVSSKVSGYALIALLIAGAGAAYWFWSELKEFGSLTEKAEQQAVTIEEQRATLQRVSAEMAAKDKALQTQQARTKQLRNNARLQQLAVQEAIKNADKVTRECMSLHLADSLQFGPTKDGSSEDKARSDVDG